MLRSAIVENLFIIGYFLTLSDYLYKWHVLYPVGYNPLWIYRARNKLDWIKFKISSAPQLEPQLHQCLWAVLGQEMAFLSSFECMDGIKNMIQRAKVMCLK